MNLNKKSVVVLGAGESGIGALSLLSRIGAKPSLFDKDVQKAKKVSQEFHAEFLDEKTLPSVMSKAYCVVLSPGIDYDSNYVVMAKALGLKIIPEIELASLCSQAKNVSVTGTNGKSSTVRLIASVLNFCGKYAVAGGNIGTAFSRFADKLTSEDVAVIETSSFQLEATEEYHSDVAIILNATKDHIDRHGSVENYLSAKAKIFKNSKESDFIIGNYDDDKVRKMLESSDVKAKRIYFSRSQRVEQGVYLDGEKIKAVIRDNEYDIGKVSDITPSNTHIENVLATIATALIFNLPMGSVYKKIRDFIPGEYTMQKVCSKGKINYVNDSKGTNVSATLHAVDCVDGKLVLIVGGREKGEDYSELFGALPKKVENLVFIGENARALSLIANGYGYDGKIAEDMKSAVKIATDMLRGEGTVLFSPACASFDGYKNYKERGEAFSYAVNGYEQK